MSLLDEMREAVNAGHAACGRIWFIKKTEEEDKSCCIECGRELGAGGYCDFCAYHNCGTERADQ